MTDFEKSIGGRIERTRSIPGLVPENDLRDVYFTCPPGENFKKYFSRIVRHIDPPLMTNGGAGEEGCALTTPAGLTFHALSYKGDLEGWEKQLTLGARALGLRMAHIEDGALVLDDGERIPLEQCEIKFS